MVVIKAREMKVQGKNDIKKVKNKQGMTYKRGIITKEIIIVIMRSK